MPTSVFQMSPRNPQYKAGQSIPADDWKFQDINKVGFRDNIYYISN